MTPVALNTMSAPDSAGRDVVVLTQGLTKIFRDFWLRPRVRAVDGLDLEIHQGEIFGLLGPNGSGKSTIIKILLGLLHKTRGRAMVFGKRPSDVAVKKRIGVLPEESYLYPFLNARETLDYYGKLFELDHRTRRRRIDELLDMVGLTAVSNRQIKEYSKGMQRRIGLAQALINDPELLILDEPTTGLDPIGTRQVKDLIVALGHRGKTILLSSHQLSDVEDCVDRMAILYGGRKRAQGTCDELLAAKGRMTIETPALDEQTISEIDRLIHERAGVSIDRVSMPRQRLEDLFVKIVDEARAEKIATSGADSGGPTASFLVEETHEASHGEALIDELVAERAPVARAPLTRRTESASDADAASSEEPGATLIESLVKGDDEREQPSRPRAKPAEAGQSGSDVPGVDRGVIGSLLDEDAAGEQQGHDEGEGAQP